MIVGQQRLWGFEECSGFMNLDKDNRSRSQHDSAVARTTACPLAVAASVRRACATVIVNADDWGRNVETTDRILDCILCGAVSSTSGMVFMEDSERAACLAREHYIDVGLHLNLTTPFSAPHCSSRLMEEQQKISRFLRSNRLAPAIYHLGLSSSFEYVVKAQLEEFERIYGVQPGRIDGHHHMHLCANVLFQGLLPHGTIVRKNFSFGSGEKSYANRIYRKLQDRILARHHRTSDFFFYPILSDRARWRKILDLAQHFNVEIETHPANCDEYEFLVKGELLSYGANVAVSRGYFLRSSDFFARVGSGDAVVTADCEPEPGVRNEVMDAGSPQRIPHISVCICTYKRPLPLKRLLSDLNGQHTEGLFTYSVVVADNDEATSAEAAVAEIQAGSAVPLKYCVEPRRGIAMARNKVIANAEGEFVALIDDDEFPTASWLLTLFKTFRRYSVDGVLGPVRRHFEEAPPAWLEKSKLYDRSIPSTGVEVDWREARTGNALLKRDLFAGDPVPFRPEFKTGEDRDFFRRKMAGGRVFVWSAEAEVFEVIPPARWKRMYYVRKALLQGASAALQPSCGAMNIAKSVIAVPIYGVALPLALLAGQQHFMTILVKLCDHAGKLLYLMGINPIREEYVSE